VIVWRMLRDERQRTDARVQTLAALSAHPADHRPQAPFDLHIRQAPVTTSAMFAERPAASPWGNRFAVMAGLALVLASGVLMALTVSDRAGAHARPLAAAGAAATAGPSAGGTSTIGIELLSLRDSRQPGSLTITGLVQNPRGGTPRSRVTVTAYAFDDKGAFLASGRALLDVATLAPGDESPFVVSVPVTETVARYRIGFRGEDGHVIDHIDKRQQAPAAALQPGSGPANW
jgi:hypothetical protein